MLSDKIEKHWVNHDCFPHFPCASSVATSITQAAFAFPGKYSYNARCFAIPCSRGVIGCPGALAAFLNDNHVTSPSLYQITMEWLDLPELQAPVYIPSAGRTEAVLFLKVRQTIAVGDLPSAVHPALLSKRCPQTDKVILCCFLLPPFGRPLHFCRPLNSAPLPPIFPSLSALKYNNSEWFNTPQSRSSNTHCSLVTCAAAANVSAPTKTLRSGMCWPPSPGYHMHTLWGHLCWSGTDGQTTDIIMDRGTSALPSLKIYTAPLFSSDSLRPVQTQMLTCKRLFLYLTEITLWKQKLGATAGKVDRIHDGTVQTCESAGLECILKGVQHKFEHKWGRITTHYNQMSSK